MNSCDISVIIPVYNREKTIEYCLNSVLKQTVLPKEIVLIDDSSSDKSKLIIDTFCEKYKFIKYICLDKNSGAQKARNTGICAAKYDWIAFLDSDDEWNIKKLEYQWNEIINNNYNEMMFVYTDCIKFDCEKQEKSLWNFDKIRNNPYKYLLKYSGPMFQGILTSKKALETIGFLDENVPSYQEWDTSIRLAKICKVIHIQQPLFTYYLHSGETISKNHNRDIEGYQYIINKFKEDIIEVYGCDGWRFHLKNQLIRCIDFKLWDLSKDYYNLLVELK